jgi:hypothetical protein
MSLDLGTCAALSAQTPVGAGSITPEALAAQQQLLQQQLYQLQQQTLQNAMAIQSGTAWHAALATSPFATAPPLVAQSSVYMGTDIR